MLRLFSTLIFTSFLLLFGCSTSSYKKTKEGVIVRIEHAKTNEVHNIGLQVVNDHVVHVSATPKKKFSTEKSLIIVPDLTYSSEFDVTEDSQFVTLSTFVLDVKVNKATGEIAFFDKNGKAILRENAGGGKTFTPIEVEGTKGYTMHQTFESPDDEAFYGLGQHQSDEFNYKGKNESLFQYNTKVSVPFFVSNKNYGILWDNNSLTKFGDPRDYGQIYQFNLFDKNGVDGKLTAT